MTRNQIYEQIYNVVTSGLELKVSKEKILTELIIKPSEVPSNAGNGATADVKYFTKYLRGVGVHVTPTVSIDGIVDDSVSSGSSEDDLVKLFEVNYKKCQRTMLTSSISIYTCVLSSEIRKILFNLIFIII